MPRGSAPGERRGGRQKGTPNKFTSLLKEMILGALDAAGGQEYLAAQAEANPAAFMILLGKVLAATLTSATNDPLIIEVVKFSETHCDFGPSLGTVTSDPSIDR
jgi:hypothetical protein